MSPPVRLGLTGGIGSGKSTVAGLLAASGAAVVDADAIAHDLTAPGGAAMAMIGAAFGQDFITPAGALEREKMRALVYTDPTARRRLEAILHPLIGLEAQSQADRASKAGRACIVFDIPLLVESPTWRQKVDHILVLDCTAEVQISRVLARSPGTRQAIEKILSSQASRERRLGAADCVIFNATLSLAELAEEVRQISHRFGLSSS